MGPSAALDCCRIRLRSPVDGQPHMGTGLGLKDVRRDPLDLSASNRCATHRHGRAGAGVHDMAPSQQARRNSADLTELTAAGHWCEHEGEHA